MTKTQKPSAQGAQGGAHGGGQGGEPQPPERGFMDKWVAGPINGAVVAETGGPFGLILQELRPDRQYPSSTGLKYGLIFPADDGGDDSPSPDGTPGKKKRHTSKG